MGNVLSIYMTTNLTSVPVVSVIMPVHNGRAYLSEAIESILNQTFTDFEYLIIDDGSTDDSGRIIESYRTKDSRIRFVQFKANKGITAALNEGLRLARGRYIARMDADDISDPKRLKIQHEYLENNQDVCVVAGSFRNIDSEGRYLSEVHHEFEISPEDSGKVPHTISNLKHMCHPTVMFRNNTGMRYREKAYFCEDKDLWLRCLSDGQKIVCLPHIVLSYRIHTQSISSEKFYLQGLFAQKMEDWYVERLKTGHDSYEAFDAQSYMREARAAVPTHTVESLTALRILVARENISGQSDNRFKREYIRTLWKINGFFSHMGLVIPYLANCLPYRLKLRLKSYARIIGYGRSSPK